MNVANPLTKDFVERQRGRLVALRRELLSVQSDEALQGDEITAEMLGSARTFEDDAQRLDALELAAQLSAANRRRLQTIDRALQKIEEGSYGLSDQSRKPIPAERLEANPQALLTLEEQASKDESA